MSDFGLDLRVLPLIDVTLVNFRNLWDVVTLLSSFRI
jgi:hypothetical protein